jgi:adenine-specific DNA-methyltransferase
VVNIETADVAVKKFQEKLKEILLPEAFDSDAGIYKILNHKRNQIEKFIDGELVSKINAVLEGHRKEERRVLDDLYAFFSKYFKDGELIPQCHCLANGKEAKLCWANCEQYYVGEIVLEKRTKRSVVRKTKDYFIHKNLKGFLLERLDDFIKTEVLNAEDIESGIIRAKLVKELGKAITDFLAQIEDFQKELWERKKQAIETEYVITLDRIKEFAGEKFLESIVGEILSNERQLKEWKELGFGEIKSREDLIMERTLYGIEWKKLPIDTRYFSQEFKERLLEKLTEKHNLNDILDGVLIKSENWQALSFLMEEYRGKVQTIYIDPPFNKGQNSDYPYSVRYKDSAWITMLENRLRLARELLNEKGSIFVRCDYNGNMYVRLLMNEIFGKENFRNEITIRKSNIQGPINIRFNPAIESLYFYSSTDLARISPQYKERKAERNWLDMHSPKENPRKHTIQIHDEVFIAPKGRHWTFSQETVERLIKENRIRIIEKEYIDVFGNKQLKIPQYLMSATEVIDSNWTDIQAYSQTQGFPTENSEILLKRVIKSTSNENDLVMDFFLGSGTTTAVAHKLKRKWIGVEMGEHFWTVIMPRMKKVLFYDKSGISKEDDVREKYNKRTAGGFFKYQVLEDFLSMEW